LDLDAGGSQGVDGVFDGDGGKEFYLDSEAAAHQWRCHIYHLPESPVVSMSFVLFCRVYFRLFRHVRNDWHGL
jgi:hypothetical protein